MVAGVPTLSTSCAYESNPGRSIRQKPELFLYGQDYIANLP
jgi:hypothetical protein